MSCAYCGGSTARCNGESSIYKSQHILCEPCWLVEDDLIEEEGTNDPESSDVIKHRLATYGRPNCDRY